MRKWRMKIECAGICCTVKTYVVHDLQGRGVLHILGSLLPVDLSGSGGTDRGNLGASGHTDGGLDTGLGLAQGQAGSANDGDGLLSSLRIGWGPFSGNQSVMVTECSVRMSWRRRWGALEPKLSTSYDAVWTDVHESKPNSPSVKVDQLENELKIGERKIPALSTYYSRG